MKTCNIEDVKKYLYFYRSTAIGKRQYLLKQCKIKGTAMGKCGEISVKFAIDANSSNH